MDVQHWRTSGDGLIEAVSDQTFEQIAESEPPAIQGKIKMVTENFAKTAHAGRLDGRDDALHRCADFPATLPRRNGNHRPRRSGRSKPMRAHQKRLWNAATRTMLFEDTTDAGGAPISIASMTSCGGFAPPPTLPQSASAQKRVEAFASVVGSPAPYSGGVS